MEAGQCRSLANVTEVISPPAGRAPLPDDIDFTVAASLPISGLTAWQGLFQHGPLQPGEAHPAHGRVVDFVVEADRAQLIDIAKLVSDGGLRTNIGITASLDNAIATFNSSERPKGKTIINLRP